MRGITECAQLVLAKLKYMGEKYKHTLSFFKACLFLVIVFWLLKCISQVLASFDPNSLPRSKCEWPFGQEVLGLDEKYKSSWECFNVISHLKKRSEVLPHHPKDGSGAPWNGACERNFTPGWERKREKC